MSQPPEARMCPVCGSEKLKSLYEDGVKSYRCEQGHTFIVKKHQDPSAESHDWRPAHLAGKWGESRAGLSRRMLALRPVVLIAISVPEDPLTAL